MYLVNVFFANFNHIRLKNNHSYSYLTCACAIALKVAKILAAQASAQPFKNHCGASPIAREIVAPQAFAAITAAQVPTSANKQLRQEHAAALFHAKSLS